MLIIDNELVSELLSMEDCIRVQEEAFKKLPIGTAIHRPRIDTYFPCARQDGYFRWSTMEGANGGYFAIRMKSDMRPGSRPPPTGVAQSARADVGSRGRRIVEHNLDLSAEEVGHRGRGPTIGHVRQRDAGHHIEEFARHMGYRPDAGRCHVNPARVSLCLSDEIWNRLGGKGRMDLHDMGRAEHAGHWRNIAEVIETEISVERRVDRVRRTIEEHRVSVCRRLHDDLGAEIAPCHFDDTLDVGGSRDRARHQLDTQRAGRRPALAQEIIVGGPLEVARPSSVAFASVWAPVIPLTKPGHGSVEPVNHSRKLDVTEQGLKRLHDADSSLFEASVSLALLCVELLLESVANLTYDSV
jgi:hypothetical protein